MGFLNQTGFFNNPGWKNNGNFIWESNGKGVGRNSFADVVHM